MQPTMVSSEQLLLPQNSIPMKKSYIFAKSNLVNTRLVSER
jgi:hypothetical protein